jgi:MFS family permease
MNASSTGISTIIPIYILALGGQVREVAMAAFLSNLAVTLGAIFWGRVIDSMHWRSTIVAICSAAIAISAASMFFVSSIPILMLLSAVVGFFSVGPAPVTNLLVMEKSKKDDWLKTYSWTSLISAVGLVIAMVAGYFWLLYYNAQSYAIACSAIAISSLALTIIFVKDPQTTLDRRALLRSPALMYRLRQVPMIFIKPMPNLSASKIMTSLSKKEMLFFAGTGLFFLSGNLMFTPYTPFLKDGGVSDAEVFLAYTILHLCKVVYLPFNHRIVALRGEEGMSKLAYVPRMMGIALAVAAALMVAANPGSILMITLVAFVGTEIGFSLWSATTTSSLLKIIPAGQEGRVLGINSAVIGAGLLIGALAAGEVSSVFGYGVTFALAIAVAIGSFVLIGKFFKKVRVAPQARV